MAIKPWRLALLLCSSFFFNYSTCSAQDGLAVCFNTKALFPKRMYNYANQFGAPAIFYAKASYNLELQLMYTVKKIGFGIEGSLSQLDCIGVDLAGADGISIAAGGGEGGILSNTNLGLMIYTNALTFKHFTITLGSSVGYTLYEGGLGSGYIGLGWYQQSPSQPKVYTVFGKSNSLEYSSSWQVYAKPYFRLEVPVTTKLKLFTEISYWFVPYSKIKFAYKGVDHTFDTEELAVAQFEAYTTFTGPRTSLPTIFPTPTFRDVRPGFGMGVIYRF